jgi:hypothetical protein
MSRFDFFCPIKKQNNICFPFWDTFCVKDIESFRKAHVFQNEISFSFFAQKTFNSEIDQFCCLSFLFEKCETQFYFLRNFLQSFFFFFTNLVLNIFSQYPKEISFYHFEKFNLSVMFLVVRTKKNLFFSLFVR